MTKREAGVFDRLLRLMGASRAQREARELLLALTPLPSFKSCFDSTSSADLDGVLEFLRQVEDLDQLLRPWPSGKTAGPCFSIEQGHTLELRLSSGGALGRATHEPEARHRLCITRLGPDLWAWYLDGPEGGDGGVPDPVGRPGFFGTETRRARA